MHIDVHANAASDLERLWESHPEAAAVVAVVLEQLEADPFIIHKLTQHGDNLVGNSRLGVKLWERPRLRPGDLWRFRIFDTPATSYRVVYGYQFTSRQICVLGIVHKEDFDYDDPSNELAKRIRADWAAI